MDNVENRIDGLRAALIEIRDVSVIRSRVSDEFQWALDIARSALDEDDKYIIKDEQTEILPFVNKETGDEPDDAA
tara:strand:- start:551 stop:775 length:225 start_codon:yes stop_codon:yes gene_type:complete